MLTRVIKIHSPKLFEKMFIIKDSGHWELFKDIYKQIDQEKFVYKHNKYNVEIINIFNIIKQWKKN